VRKRRHAEEFFGAQPLAAAPFDTMLGRMTTSARISILAVSGVLAFAAACGNDATPPPASPSTSSAATPAGSESAAAPVAAPMPASAPTGTTSMTATTDLAVGKPPPDFTAKDQAGKELKLSALKGKPVVVYFYPKDETPGCTKEACAFRDAWKDIDKKGVVLIGISADNADSHKAFAKHHQLPFHLVSDESGAIAKSFGVPNNGGYLGRQSFVVGADGNVKKIYREVDVTKHASEILVDVGP
jgi:peroxiredoxin Q/BCP